MQKPWNFETLKLSSVQIPKNSEGSRKLSSFFVKTFEESTSTLVTCWFFLYRKPNPWGNRSFKIKPQRPLKKHPTLIQDQASTALGSITHPQINTLRRSNQRIKFERDCNPKSNQTQNIILYTCSCRHSLRETFVFTHVKDWPWPWASTNTGWSNDEQTT